MIEIRLTLHCETRGCTATLDAPDDDIRKVQQLRAVAYREHGCSTRGGDHCPAHTTRGGDRR